MTLEALGRQYAAEADNLAGMIESCKERRGAALSAGDSSEAIRQENLAELHEQQRNDLLQLAAWLKNYYEPGTEAEREEEQSTDLKG